MFDLINIGTLLGLVVGAFIGVMLGRRSKSANAYADRIQAQLDRANERLRDLGQ